jgi:leader peptidase (prepilin peptidase)/N-methyltransferase
MAGSLILVAIIGILAGGVVNALADDLPQRRNPRLPHYPDDTPRPPIAWLGLSAFLFGKRTSPNGARLSWRHPLVEIMTALLMILVVVKTSEPELQVSPLQGIFWLVYMAIFVLITVIDIEHKLILFVVIIPSAIIALADALLTPTQHPPTLVDALIGGVSGFLVFFVMYNGGFLFTYIMGKMRGQEIRTVAFGYGDVMMATLSGLMLGWRPLIFAMFITVFLGAFGAILYLVTRSLLGKRYSAFTAIPYGPYIVAGTLIMLLFSHNVAMLFGSRPPS